MEIEGQINNIRVVNSIGQEVFYNKSVNSSAIDLSFLPEGFYMMTYISRKQMMQQKMIKVE